MTKKRIQTHTDNI